ncbi:hypothetical protein diail_1824 [Diaporthe ilicicola]|nr:hypothetical protein diail_1824 [Diaporthe ilicicola]
MADHQSNRDATAGDDEDTTTAAGATMIALSVIVVVCRFYIRLKLKSGLKWDDWFILISLTSIITAGVLVVAASTVDPDSAWLSISQSDPNYVYTPGNETHLLLSWVSSIFYFCVVCAAKLSILFMYKRIFSVSPVFRRQVYLVVTIVSMYWVAIVLADIFNCIPFKYSWISSMSPAPYCFNFNLFWFSTGIIETVLDVVIISLPVSMVAKLHLSVKKRIGIGGVFLLGAFGIVTGAIRVWSAYLPGQRSPSWGESEVWSSIHAGVCIICACLPVCWPLISPLFSKIRGSSISLRDRWRSRNSHPSFERKSGSRQSREEYIHPARLYTPGPQDTELLTMSNTGISPSSGVNIAYPQPARGVSPNNSDDEVFVIQGAHEVQGYGHAGYRA